MAMNLVQRHKAETKYMDSLQGSSKRWKRCYIISTKWVASWLRYAESEDKQSVEPPGPVNNENIMRTLCALKAGEERKDPRAEFYSISKHLFYFFISMYGGGPVVVQKAGWNQYEPHENLVPSETPRDSLPETPRQKVFPEMPNYEDGIVGLQNNTFYCYMNACLQCLVPITELRDHYVLQRYFDVAERGTTKTRNNFDFSNRLHEFYDAVYSKSKRRPSVIRPTLKLLLRGRFDPI